MKIALITIHNANNYGAILQTFALKTVLGNYGEVDIINYDNRHISRSFDLVRFELSFHGLLGTGKDIFRLLPRRRVIGSFTNFIDENLNLTKALSASELQDGHGEGYDCYVAGSDQIWNPLCVNKEGALDPVYFLDFCPVGAKKISYASSLGSYQLSVEEGLRVKEYLDTFSMVSVREQGAQLSLSKLLGKDVSHVLDPSLLLSKSKWLEIFGLSKNRETKEKYILLYTVPKASLVRDAVDFCSKKIGLKVIAIDQGLGAGAKVDDHIRDAGPLDFIRLFADADFVITDSFHGVCFSLNFGKPFVAVSPGKYANRIESLLKLVGLESRMVKSAADFADLQIDLDFTAAHQRLLVARRASLEILSKAIEQ